MSSDTFEKLVHSTVCGYIAQKIKYNEGNTTTLTMPDAVLIVWQSKVLQNNKAIAITSPYDNRLYEVTYNGDKSQVYLDVYKKEQNVSYDVITEEGKA